MCRFHRADVAARLNVVGGLRPVEPANRRLPLGARAFEVGFGPVNFASAARPLLSILQLSCPHL